MSTQVEKQTENTEELGRERLDYNRLFFWATDVLESLAYALTQTSDRTTRDLIAQEFYHALNRRGMPNFFVQPMITNTLAKAESICRRH